ncbi:Uncharacterized protein QTN25_006950 [Entamoeba marina]
MFVNADYLLSFQKYYLHEMSAGECYCWHGFEYCFRPYLIKDVLAVYLYSDNECNSYISEVTIETIGFDEYSTFIYSSKLPKNILVNLREGCNSETGVNFHQFGECLSYNSTSYVTQTMNGDTFTTNFFNDNKCTDVINTRTLNCGECFYDENFGIQRTVDCSRVLSDATFDGSNV